MFARLWRDAGGRVWPATAHCHLYRVLHTHVSPPLATMVTDINKFSNNVMARQLLLTIDAEAGASARRRPNVPDAASVTGRRRAASICRIW